MLDPRYKKECDHGVTPPTFPEHTGIRDEE